VTFPTGNPQRERPTGLESGGFNAREGLVTFPTLLAIMILLFVWLAPSGFNAREGLVTFPTVDELDRQSEPK